LRDAPFGRVVIRRDGHSPSQALQHHVTVTVCARNVCSGRTVPIASQNLQRCGTFEAKHSRSLITRSFFRAVGRVPPARVVAIEILLGPMLAAIRGRERLSVGVGVLSV
jgi:hypothetical protein